MDANNNFNKLIEFAGLFDPLPTELSFLEVVSRYRDPQLQPGDNYSNLFHGLPPDV